MFAGEKARRMERNAPLDEVDDASSLPCGACAKLAVSRTLHWMLWAKNQNTLQKRMHADADALAATATELEESLASSFRLPARAELVAALGVKAGNAAADSAEAVDLQKALNADVEVRESLDSLQQASETQHADADKLGARWRSEWSQYERDIGLRDDATLDCPDLACDPSVPGDCILVSAIAVEQWAADKAVAACPAPVNQASDKFGNGTATDNTGGNASAQFQTCDSSVWARQQLAVSLNGSLSHALEAALGFLGFVPSPIESLESVLGTQVNTVLQSLERATAPTGQLDGCPAERVDVQNLLHLCSHSQPAPRRRLPCACSAHPCTSWYFPSRVDRFFVAYNRRRVLHCVTPRWIVWS